QEEEEQDREEEVLDVADTQEELMGEDEENVLEEHEEEELQPVNPVLPPEVPWRLFTCPQCRKGFCQSGFRPNVELANMVQVIRQMQPTSEHGGPVNENMCPKHQEALKLFCTVDEEAICVVCRASRGHRKHSVVPLGQVVQAYKTQLQEQLEPLRRHLEAVQNLKAREESRLMEGMSQMNAQVAHVSSEFGQLTYYLYQEQKDLERHMKDQYRCKIGQAQVEAERLSELTTKLSCLLAEAQERSQRGNLRLLRETLGKCEEIQRQLPHVSSPDLSNPKGDDFMKDAVVRKMSLNFCEDAGMNETSDPGTSRAASVPSSACHDPPDGHAEGY
ncbi:E3 ubiquitin-protein ligase TRIM41-like, partial [Ochotona curzoniae]|uniref:E3 ubiquitin-protein ligase TRIM41-like n=1 Tax=Ochotona curzoniae TaxID=130825 RepID=UPI001B3494F6